MLGFGMGRAPQMARRSPARAPLILSPGRPFPGEQAGGAGRLGPWTHVPPSPRRYGRREMKLLRLLLFLPLALLLPVLAAPATPGRYFVVRVVDDRTGRGVPLVELRTVSGVRYFTDSAGVAALDEPSFARKPLFLFVQSHGYEFPADGFGMRGRAVVVEPGKETRLEVRRLNVAERLYRVTGEGIYRDSVLAGRTVPVRHPLLNAGVLGQDSVQNVVYRGRLYWFWGDTSLPRYPLGNFHMSGAVTPLPGPGKWDPDRGVDLEYFVDEKGEARGMAPLPGPGPTWLDGFTTVGEGKGEQLFAAYSKIREPLEVYERGLCRWNDRTEQFDAVARFPADAPIYPHGHPVRRREGDREYVYFGDPFPLVRAPASAEALADLSRYEAYTCLLPGSNLTRPRVDRGPDGSLAYRWRKDAPPVGPTAQQGLVSRGLARADELLFGVTDVESGKAVTIHRGTVSWNEYRRRWILIGCEIGGTSHLGEIWYAEAPDPLGPWGYARKVVTHERYSFYNPAQHPQFDQDGGRRIYFEGTYTHSFSGNPDRTPRYDYNQVMYRLDLADPRLVLPGPPAPRSLAGGKIRLDDGFFVCDRPREGAVPVRLRDGRLTASGEGETVFHALPPGSGAAGALPLFEWTHADGTRTYSSRARGLEPAMRSPDPVCAVWRVRGRAPAGS